MTSYPPPVDYLIGLGNPRELPSKELDLQTLGIGKEHVPLLLEMLADPQFEDESNEGARVWTHVHVWRTLGELRALEAVEPLLRFIEKYGRMWSDWILKEFPEICAQIGPKALPLLVDYLMKPPVVDMYAQSTIIQAVAKIGAAYPEMRDATVATLTTILHRHGENDKFLNGSIIGNLLDLDAVEALPVIERAFAAGCVDEFVAGDWDEVQAELGLKTRSPFMKRPVAREIDIPVLREVRERRENKHFKPVELSPQLPLELEFKSE